MKKMDNQTIPLAPLRSRRVALATESKLVFSPGYEPQDIEPYEPQDDLDLIEVRNYCDATSALRLASVERPRLKVIVPFQKELWGSRTYRAIVLHQAREELHKKMKLRPRL